MPRKFDWYIATEVLKPYAAAALLIYFVLTMFQSFRVADFLIVHHVPLDLVLRIQGSMTLTFLPWIMSVGFLSSVLVAFGRFSSDSEIVALKACGVGAWRMSAPVFVIGAVVVLISLGLNLFWAPWGERAQAAILQKVANSRVTTVLREKTFNVGFYDLLLYADKIDAESGSMEKVFLYDAREAGNPMVVVARRGEALPVRTTSGDDDLSHQILLRLHDGKSYNLDSANANSQVFGFRDYSLYLKVDAAGGDSFQAQRTHPASQLMRDMMSFARGTPEWIAADTEFWKRIAISLSPVFFVLLGVGLGISRTRTVQGRGAILTLLIMVVYWQTLVYGWDLAGRGKALPAIALELPNVIMAIAGYAAFRRAAW